MNDGSTLSLALFGALLGSGPGMHPMPGIDRGPSGHPWPRRLRRQHYRQWPPAERRPLKNSALPAGWHLHIVENECRRLCDVNADGTVDVEVLRGRPRTNGRTLRWGLRYRVPMRKALDWFRNAVRIEAGRGGTVDPFAALSQAMLSRGGWS